MSFENIARILSAPKYLAIWAASAAVLMGLYIGPLTDRSAYDTLGWIFAIAFPILAGAVIAAQWYNQSERKFCPGTAMGGGIAGSILGLITVACPVCPAVLLGWLGLAAALPGTLLGGPWLKLMSLVLLALALYWATNTRSPA